MKDEKVVHAALKLGELMLIHGAEIYRVEDSIKRICSSYGMKRTSVFSIPTSIIITTEFNDGESFTISRDIGEPFTNLDKVDKLNALSRYICQNTPDYSHIESELEQIENKKAYSNLLITIMYSLVSAVFCLFFEGGVTDALIAGFIGVLIIILINKLTNMKTNYVFINAICGGIAATFAILSVFFGIANNEDSIIMGSIMTLVPGLSLTNSMRDFILGDMLAGIMALLEAILISVGIVIGITVAFFIFGKLI